MIWIRFKGGLALPTQSTQVAQSDCLAIAFLKFVQHTLQRCVDLRLGLSVRALQACAFVTYAVARRGQTMVGLGR